MQSCLIPIMTYNRTALAKDAVERLDTAIQMYGSMVVAGTLIEVA